MFLQVATLVRWERRATLAKPSIRGLWSRLMTRAMSQLDDTGARFARVVFVENTLMHAYLLRFLEKDRVVFSPPGVDTEHLHAGSHTRRVSPVRRPVR